MILRIFGLCAGAHASALTRLAVHLSRPHASNLPPICPPIGGLKNRSRPIQSDRRKRPSGTEAQTSLGRKPGSLAMRREGQEGPASAPRRPTGWIEALRPKNACQRGGQGEATASQPGGRSPDGAGSPNEIPTKRIRGPEYEDLSPSFAS